MKIIQSIVLIGIFRGICFPDAYFFNCESCGFEQIRCDTSYLSEPYTVITEYNSDSQMVCEADTYRRIFSPHYDTTVRDISFPVIGCQWNQCIRYSLFDDRNSEYEIRCMATLSNPSHPGGSCYHECAIDSIRGVRDTRPSIGNEISFTFSADTVQCLFMGCMIYGINKTTGDTLWTDWRMHYNVNELFRTDVAKPEKDRPDPAGNGNKVTANDLFVNNCLPIHFYTLNGKKADIYNRAGFNSLPNGIYLLRVNRSVVLKIVKLLPPEAVACLWGGQSPRNKQDEQYCSHLPSYSTGGASGFLVSNPWKG